MLSRKLMAMCVLFLLGIFCMSSMAWGENLTNLALKKKARQSSTNGGDAQRAVDGNRDGSYSANSVTHTGNSPGEWWEVDLGSVQQIKEIIIWNRTDCCGERLADFSVLVSERPFPSGLDNLHTLLGDSSVWSSRNEGVAGVQTPVPVDAAGRYVRIQMSGTNYLSLAEVEVMGESRGGNSGGYGGGYGGGSKASATPAVSANLALKKKARQSSTGYGGDAQRAVDGNKDGNYGANSVSHTNNSPGEWWEVDLGSVRQIKEIIVWNRTDCCSERLADFSVMVSERPFSSNNLDNLLDDSSVWSYRNDGAAGKQTQLTVGVSGRYVRIQMAGTNYLSLAEVEVTGESRSGNSGGYGGGYGGGSKASATPAVSTNLALKKKARQSSNTGGEAQRAVDGNRDGNFFANSVTHTGNSPGEWWEVDLGSVRQIKEITIWNRTDCCGERLADFSVLISERPFSSNSLDNLLGDSSVWSHRNDGAAAKQTQVPVDVSGRYVRVQLSGANYLSLAEVEVMGQ